MNIKNVFRAESSRKEGYPHGSDPCFFGMSIIMNHVVYEMCYTPQPYTIGVRKG